MRVLIFHGYMLRGTGSNIYNANLARALARLGHEVHLLCQDREVEIEGVQIHNPDIGGLLPVYVKDPYEGFEVKAFPELTEAELDRYIDANVAAVRAVAEAAGGIDAALANHLVMGPAILARAERRPLRRQDPRLGARVHGQTASRASFPTPTRAWRRPPASSSAPATPPSPSGRRSRMLPGLEEKTRLGPPGVDIDAFRPSEADGEVRERIPRPQALPSGSDGRSSSSSAS